MMGSLELGSMLVPSSVRCGAEAGISQELASQPGSQNGKLLVQWEIIFQGKKVDNDSERHVFS